MSKAKAQIAVAPAFDNTRSCEEQNGFIPEGFAGFNHCDHLCVDIPDGGFTITTRDSKGKRMTFHFGVYKADGSPQFVDIQYHDNGTSWHNGGQDVPTFDCIAFGGSQSLFDSRRSDQGPSGGKVGILCVLTEDPKG